MTTTLGLLIIGLCILAATIFMVVEVRSDRKIRSMFSKSDKARGTSGNAALGLGSAWSWDLGFIAGITHSVKYLRGRKTAEVKEFVWFSANNIERERDLTELSKHIDYCWKVIRNEALEAAAKELELEAKIYGKKED